MCVSLKGKKKKIQTTDSWKQRAISWNQPFCLTHSVRFVTVYFVPKASETQQTVTDCEEASMCPTHLHRTTHPSPSLNNKFTLLHTENDIVKHLAYLFTVPSMPIVGEMVDTRWGLLAHGSRHETQWIILLTAALGKCSILARHKERFVASAPRKSFVCRATSYRRRVTVACGRG